MLYSIEDTTLTAIADAIRARCGEEPSVYAGSTEIIEYSFPSFIDEGVSFPPVAGDEYNPSFSIEIDEENAVTIPGAMSLEINMYVKMRPQASRNYVEVDGTQYTSSGAFNGEYGTEGVEDFHNFTVEGDTVIFHFWSNGFYGIGGYGYAAEIRGLDENGEYIEGGSGDSGNENGMTPLEMPDRIVNIPDYVPVIQEITITENGEFQVPEGVDGFHPIYVDVPPEQIVPVLDTLNVVENGTYVPNGVDGYNMVIVDVPTGGGDIEVEPIVLEGTQTYGCCGALSGKYIDMFGDTISTQYLGDVSNMFYKNTATKIPFDLNCTNVTYYGFGALFQDCYNLTELPNIYDAYPYTINNMFSNCHKLREIPEGFSDTWNWDRLHTYNYASVNGCIQHTYSLRKISESFMKNLWSLQTSTYNSLYYGLCNNCYTLDEIRGIPIMPVTYTSNAFTSFMNMCVRVKDIIFDMNEDGTPKVANWQNQNIDIGYAKSVGYLKSDGYTFYVLGNNSGITADKEVYDDASYQALKDDPDWFATSVLYSRYNHDSAVNTINSLPDTSAYIAANGGTNTITFYGDAGVKTDGGAISNLTEEEIAIATAKGWTVTLS